MDLKVLPVSETPVRMGAEPPNARLRQTALDNAESSLNKAESGIVTRQNDLESAQKTLNNNQAQIDSSRSQISTSQSSLDQARSQLSSERAKTTQPNFGSSKSNNTNLQTTYPPEANRDNQDMPQGVFPGVNPDVMNQIIRTDGDGSSNDPATQADKQPDPPKPTVEIISPSEASQSKSDPRLSSMDIQRPKLR